MMSASLSSSFAFPQPRDEQPARLGMPAEKHPADTLDETNGLLWNSQNITGSR